VFRPDKRSSVRKKGLAGETNHLFAIAFCSMCMQGIAYSH
jgi:hypothetical protein